MEVDADSVAEAGGEVDADFSLRGGLLACSTASCAIKSLFRLSSSMTVNSGSTLLAKRSCIVTVFSSQVSAVSIAVRKEVNSTSVYLDGCPVAVSFSSCFWAELRKAWARLAVMRRLVMASDLPRRSAMRFSGVAAARL